MKAKPIRFITPAVRATLDGRMTVTRRAMNPQPHLLDQVRYMTPDRLDGGGFGLSSDEGDHLCPYGGPGDLLYVREPWRTHQDLDDLSGTEIATKSLLDGYRAPWAPVQYEADHHRRDWSALTTIRRQAAPEPGRLRAGASMPYWASRIILEITDVQGEQLGNIDERGASDEGIYRASGDRAGFKFDRGEREYVTAVEAYRALWEQMNGPGSWNPSLWVWVIRFRWITQGITA